MPLTSKRKMTEKSSAASRRNGRKSRGAVTPAGKARAAQANLRHGFYSDAPQAVLIALGEDPAKYMRLLESLENNLAEGLEAQLVRRVARAPWRMQRAERMQDGLAVKRVQCGLQKEGLAVAPLVTHNYDIYQRRVALGTALNRQDSFPSAAEIQAFISGFETPSPVTSKNSSPSCGRLGKRQRRRRGRQTKTAVESRSLRQPRGRIGNQRARSFGPRWMRHCSTTVRATSCSWRNAIKSGHRRISPR